MIDIEIRSVGPYYKEITGENAPVSGLLDKKEAIEAACEFISAAERLLPPTHSDAENDLSVIREALEVTK